MTVRYDPSRALGMGHQGVIPQEFWRQGCDPFTSCCDGPRVVECFGHQGVSFKSFGHHRCDPLRVCGRHGVICYEFRALLCDPSRASGIKV